MEKIVCQLKHCELYKGCSNKKNPFKGNKLCWGYEKYANQDWKKQHEEPIAYLGDILDMENSKEIYKEPAKSKKELICELYFTDHKKPDDIYILVGCSIQYVYRIIKETYKIIKSSQKKKK